MAVYTGIRLKVKIKDEYRKDIERANESRDWSVCKKDLLNNLSNLERAEYILSCDCTFANERWINGELETDGFVNSFDSSTGIWTKQVVVSGGFSVLKYFVDVIIPKICEEGYHIEILPEAEPLSYLFELKDGKTEQLNYGIFYGEEWELKYMANSDDDILYDEFKFAEV